MMLCSSIEPNPFWKRHLIDVNTLVTFINISVVLCLLLADSYGYIFSDSVYGINSTV